MAIVGSIKIDLPLPNSPTNFNMSSAQNINTGTIVPVVVNPESIPVDLDLEEDLQEIQHEVALSRRESRRRLRPN